MGKAIVIDGHFLGAARVEDVFGPVPAVLMPARLKKTDALIEALRCQSQLILQEPNMSLPQRIEIGLAHSFVIHKAFDHAIGVGDLAQPLARFQIALTFRLRAKELNLSSQNQNLAASLIAVVELLF